MKQSQRLEKRYNQLRSQLHAEIGLLHKMHMDIEVEPEFKNPIAYAAGMDEQDEYQLIEEVTVTEVVVYHQGNEVERVKYEDLTTEVLLALLKGMEQSYEEAKKFVEGN